MPSYPKRPPVGTPDPLRPTYEVLKLLNEATGALRLGFARYGEIDRMALVAATARVAMAAQALDGGRAVSEVDRVIAKTRAQVEADRVVREQGVAELEKVRQERANRERASKERANGRARPLDNGKGAGVALGGNDSQSKNGKRARGNTVTPV